MSSTINASSAGSLQVLFGTGSGPTYKTSGYYWSAVSNGYNNAGGATTCTGAANTNSITISGDFGYVESGYFYVHNLQALNSTDTSVIAYTNSTSSGHLAYANGTNTMSSPVTAIQISNYNNGYNISKAIVSLYGISS